MGACGIISIMGAQTGVAPQIRALKERFPEMAPSAIARRVGCDPSNVTRVLQTYLNGASIEDLRGFQENKADVYDSLQRSILESITAGDFVKAPLMARVTSAAILEDKARLVRGQATSINVNVLMDVVDAIRTRRDNQQPIRTQSVVESE